MPGRVTLMHCSAAVVWGQMEGGASILSDLGAVQVAVLEQKLADGGRGDHGGSFLSRVESYRVGLRRYSTAGQPTPAKIPILAIAPVPPLLESP